MRKQARLGCRQSRVVHFLRLSWLIVPRTGQDMTTSYENETLFQTSTEMRIPPLGVKPRQR